MKNLMLSAVPVENRTELLLSTSLGCYHCTILVGFVVRFSLELACIDVARRFHVKFHENLLNESRNM
jgi:hypothetical protein